MDGAKFSLSKYICAHNGGRERERERERERRERGREMVTKLKSKYCPLKTSVRQDAATGLFEPQRYRYCIQSSFPSISSSAFCTNKSVSQDNAVFL